MEKQYSTHYLSEKYKQHYFIHIYHFEITVLNTQSTAQLQKSQSKGDVRFFSTRARGSGHQVSLAKRPRPSLHGTIMENRCSKFFVSYLQVKLCHGLDSLNQDQVPSQLCLIKLFQYKRGMYFTFDFGWCSIHFDVVR